MIMSLQHFTNLGSCAGIPRMTHSENCFAMYDSSGVSIYPSRLICNKNSQYIKMKVACCYCQYKSSSQPKEPLMNHELPDHPWEMTAIKFFTVDGSRYMVTVDCYLDYFELDSMRSKETTAVIKHLKLCFSCHGVPVIISLIIAHCLTRQPFSSLQQNMHSLL